MIRTFLLGHTVNTFQKLQPTMHLLTRDFCAHNKHCAKVVGLGHGNEPERDREKKGYCQMLLNCCAISINRAISCFQLPYGRLCFTFTTNVQCTFRTSANTAVTIEQSNFPPSELMQCAGRDLYSGNPSSIPPATGDRKSYIHRNIYDVIRLNPGRIFSYFTLSL
jgi:hypothetical protein